ncbi:hypothetical protein [Candidatus Symbiopectobacterium sp. NZEC135]|nr:hypothetical protein [Candidatus Symbiopectobacterium sp. NZEC135]
MATTPISSHPQFTFPFLAVRRAKFRGLSHRGTMLSFAEGVCHV